MGPLVSEAQGAKVMDYIAGGRAEGARLLTGGARARIQGFEGGFFVQPTVFADVTDDDDDRPRGDLRPRDARAGLRQRGRGVERANATSFGLAAGVFTADLARAHRVIARLQAGTTWINAYNLTPWRRRSAA